MADEDPASPSENAPTEPAPIELPPRESFPPPPDVTFTRPDLSGRSGPKAAASWRPSSGARPQGADRSEDDGSPALKLGGGLAAGTTFVASVVAGFLIGQWIDHRWNHGGGMAWGTLIFSLLGVAAGFLNLFRVLSATDRGSKKK